MATALQDILKLTRSQAECLSVLRHPRLLSGEDRSCGEARPQKHPRPPFDNWRRWRPPGKPKRNSGSSPHKARRAASKPSPTRASKEAGRRDPVHSSRTIRGMGRSTAASSQPGASGQRLIDLLDRPMRGP